MNKIIITLCMLLYCGIADAGIFVFHTGETITGKRDSCGRACAVRPDALRIDLATFNSITRFHKVVSGVVVEMSQAEKDVILQAEEDSRLQAIEDALDKFEVSNLELMTALIQRINTRIPSNPITKQEIIQQIKDNR